MGLRRTDILILEHFHTIGYEDIGEETTNNKG
jgi:hypothetical protein